MNCCFGNQGVSKCPLGLAGSTEGLISHGFKMQHHSRIYPVSLIQHISGFLARSILKHQTEYPQLCWWSLVSRSCSIDPASPSLLWTTTLPSRGVGATSFWTPKKTEMLMWLSSNISSSVFLLLEVISFEEDKIRLEILISLLVQALSCAVGHLFHHHHPHSYTICTRWAFIFLHDSSCKNEAQFLQYPFHRAWTRTAPNAARHFPPLQS